jgi:hypothetical protein
LCGRSRLLGFGRHRFCLTHDLYFYAVRQFTVLNGQLSMIGEATMKVIELKPEDFPVMVSLSSPDGDKQYLLIKTKQGKLLLNRPMESVQSSK